jgi:hypothetical protein
MKHDASLLLFSRPLKYFVTLRASGRLGNLRQIREAGRNEQNATGMR